jgi:hypothetical protein
VATLARHWRDQVTATRRAGAERRRYLEVRFEELVAAPRLVLERICGFIDLRYDPAMERYHEGAAARLAEVADVQPIDGLLVTREQRLRQHPNVCSPPLPARAGRWRREMSAADRAVFEAHAGWLLRELGYEDGAPPHLVGA